MTDSSKHFIEQRIEADLAEKEYPTGIITRFPPEPNGFLHVGHAKSICLNFGMAEQYQGQCNLRFDDTNPAKEETRYMDAIKADIEWLGFKWAKLNHAADYFEQLYQFAVDLIKQGNAYVCSLNAEQMREYRGTLTEAGKDSPYRERTVDENLDLFTRMRAGDFAEGEHVLRAKIDMSSGNINLRDPIIYRILKQTHPHTGDAWCVYPMYDFAHSLSDGIEGITHSLCTLEFQDHRPLYDWFLEKLMPEPRPQQIEFSRLNVSHTISSKRKLKLLVDEGHVEDWDDPRMPTLVGLRRRGFTPAAIKNLCKQVGISKCDSVIDMSLLEECVRDDLNQHAKRAFAVLKPLKIVITNYDEDKTEQLNAPNHPQDESMGSRTLPFSRELYIEQDDFMENPPGKYKRLSPGKEVRLRYAYVIRCDEVIKDDAGNIVELRCSYDADTLGKNPEGRKVKGVIHWLSVKDAKACEVRLYDRLFKVANPASAKSTEELLSMMNPDSLEILAKAYVETSVAEAESGHYQFERLGYFTHDNKHDGLVFNRVVSLRDSWQ